jgi:hypothetical protein
MKEEEGLPEKRQETRKSGVEIREDGSGLNYDRSVLCACMKSSQ